MILYLSAEWMTGGCEWLYIEWYTKALGADGEKLSVKYLNAQASVRLNAEWIIDGSRDIDWLSHTEGAISGSRWGDVVGGAICTLAYSRQAFQFDYYCCMLGKWAY